MSNAHTTPPSILLLNKLPQFTELEKANLTTNPDIEEIKRAL